MVKQSEGEMGCTPSSASVAVSPVDEVENPTNSLVKKSLAQTYKTEKVDDSVSVHKKYLGVFVGCLLIRFDTVMPMQSNCKFSSLFFTSTTKCLNTFL